MIDLRGCIQQLTLLCAIFRSVFRLSFDRCLSICRAWRETPEVLQDSLGSLNNNSNNNNNNNNSSSSINNSTNSSINNRPMETLTTVRIVCGTQRTRCSTGTGGSGPQHRATMEISTPARVEGEEGDIRITTAMDSH